MAELRDDCIFCQIVAGRAPAHRVAEDDLAVAFCDIDLEGADEAAAAAGALERALAVHADVTDEESVQMAFDRVVGHWGGLDICVCAAGVAPPYDLQYPVTSI